MKDAFKLLGKLVGPVTVGMLLRAYRAKNDNMGQEELAKKLEVSIGFISNVETGKKKISLAKTLEICKTLGENERHWMSVYFEEEARDAGAGDVKVSVKDSKAS